MAGWIWVVIAVVLGVVIFLLLRTRSGNGRHQAPAVEYVPPVADDVEQHSDVEPADDVEPVDDDEPVEDVEVSEHVEELASAPVGELTPEEEEQEELEWAHGAAGEDAELRHDEGYVETFGNDRTDAMDDQAAEQADDPSDEPSETVAPAGVQESGYGTGSAVSRRGVAGPQGWTVKGNADSLLFYTEDAPVYGRAAADVWFDSEDAATAAGFTRWDAHHR